MKTLFTADMIYKSRELGARRFYDMTTEYDWVKRNAFAYPKKEALVDTLYGIEAEKRRRKTWPQALNDINLYIFNLLEAGLFKGETLICQLPNCIEHYYAYIAASKIGCWFLSNHVDFGQTETQGILEHVKPTIAIITPDWRGRDIVKWYKEYQKQHPELKKIYVIGDEVPEGTVSVSELLNPKIMEKFIPEDLDALKVGVFDPWIILETSGSTGLPKLVVHGSYYFQTFTISFSEKVNYTSRDKALLFGPMSGTAGKWGGIWTPLAVGAAVVLQTHYSDEWALRLTEEEKITMWNGVPAMGERALLGPFAEKYDLSSLIKFASAGGPISKEISSHLIDKGVVITNAYGTTESGGIASTNHWMKKDELLHSIGTPPAGLEIAIVDSEANRVPHGEVGELYIWALHHGYYNQPEYENDTWIKEGKWKGYQKTGDLGRFDERGHLVLTGRSKDMILRGSLNIFPKEIEDILSSHPKISQVSIVKMPDPILHERACAFVVLKHGAEKLTLDEVGDFLGGKGLGRMIYPERLEIIDVIPTGVAGKVDKTRLEMIIAEKIKEESV
ncbi:MAG: class I adenylate-forming enzyme family protein [Desulfobacterales bacterium]|jgi:acyl-CoA synthetase (AMP-forming)/AMP-acid ligase II|nr:class I adenylate-forming enzyme family protein [Desulfobacterales bacterium]